MLYRRLPRIVTRSPLLALAVAVSAATTACTSDPTPAVDADDYRAALSALCTATAEERASLDAPDDAGVAAFARTVADSLTRQAEAARVLRPPNELDDDHRAFVQNTDDQAARWADLAATPTDDTEEFGTIQTAILELTLGRDDLATDMDVPACRVQPD